jgi:transposase-like protein
MKRTYQMREWKAVEQFRSHLSNDPGAIQMVLPLAEIAQLLRQGVSQLLHEAEKRLLLMIMDDEVAWLTGDRHADLRDRELQRWGHVRGSVVVHGQKLPIHRPRVRGQSGEMKLGSYQLFRQEDAMQRQVWDRIMRGLTMRGYSPAIRECSAAFGVQKSVVSERFIQASAKCVQELIHRDLHNTRLCALMLDGVEFRSEHMLVALGIDRAGHKMVLGLHQGASENQKVCDALLADLSERGLDFQDPMLAVIDGSKALRAALRKYSGDLGLVQRCQLHKRRNVCGHFSDEKAAHWDRKLAQANEHSDYPSARKALERIQGELRELNPSAVRSLTEGLEETLTLHRLNAPLELRRTLRSTNPIESAFSIVRVACRNVKRWRPGDHLERWVGSGLVVAERQFRRIVGYRALPGLIAVLDGDSKTARSTSTAA